LKALDYLNAGGKSTVLNCGYGHGYSVREVLNMVEEVAAKRLNVREEPTTDAAVLRVVLVDEVLDLTGQSTTVGDVEWVELQDGGWVQSQFLTFP